METTGFDSLALEPQFNRLAISFSGGRTSAAMTKLLLDKYRDTHEVVVTFANTGWEHPSTLDFVRDCDRYWGFKTVWLEGVYTQEKGIGVRHKIVNYNCAARNGEPFKSYASVYGLPNATSHSCSSKLKRDVQEHYLKTIGYFRGAKLNYTTAIGIRADEIDRVGTESGIWYPLVVWEITKNDINTALASVPWDLKLPSDAYGNCLGCWKKSDRKLFTLAVEYPQAFDVAKDLEDKYSCCRLDRTASISPDGTRKMYRKHRTSQDIINQAFNCEFTTYKDPTIQQLGLFDKELDLHGGCQESCEAY